MLSRREILLSSLISPLAVAAPSFAENLRPSGAKRPRIIKVHPAELLGIPAGKGLVLPWDAKGSPLDTRDYVVTQFVTDQGLIGTTMDGDYRLPEDIGRLVQERAEAGGGGGEGRGGRGERRPPVWDYRVRLTTAKELEELSVYWLEEPLGRVHCRNWLRLRRELQRMRLAGAEGDVGLERFGQILTAGAFSYLQPDPMIGGGVW